MFSARERWCVRSQSSNRNGTGDIELLDFRIGRGAISHITIFANVPEPGIFLLLACGLIGISIRLHLNKSNWYQTLIIEKYTLFCGLLHFGITIRNTCDSSLTSERVIYSFFLYTFSNHLRECTLTSIHIVGSNYDIVGTRF